MGVITWRRQLSVGQPSIDEDHKHLIGYLNELDTALNARTFYAARVAQILVKLLEYTRDHFGREEKIMQLVQYPKIDDHVRQHREAVKMLGDLSNVFAQDPTHQNAERIYNFTANWLVNHIIMQDTQLTPYVRGVWV